MKWIIGIVVIVVIAAAAAWKLGYLANLMAPAPAPVAQQQTTSQTAPQSGLPTAQSDTSDGAVTQDAAAIDTQITASQNDSASVDQSLKDQPVEQSY